MLEVEEQRLVFRAEPSSTRPLAKLPSQSLRHSSPSQCQAVNANAANAADPMSLDWTPPRGGGKWAMSGMCPLQRAWFPVRAVGDVRAAIANRQCPGVIEKSFGFAKLSD